MNPGGVSAKKVLFAFIGILCGFLVSLLGLEIVFRILPTSDSLKTQPVNSDHPFLHFLPNQELLLSKGSLFQIRAEKHTNNYGYLSDLDFYKLSRPKLIVIGDSYVEAAQIENKMCFHGLLNSKAAEKGEAVYGIGSSGSALSQYLAYARFGIEEFEPKALCIVVVANDFDESLLEYKKEPGFHYFEQTVDGYKSTLIPYQPSKFKNFLRRFALVRYLFLNVGIENLRFSFPSRHKDEQLYVGNVFKNVDQEKINKSKNAIDFFLTQISAVSKGIPIMFVIDGIRPELYTGQAFNKSDASYFSIMRSYFKLKAERENYEVIDMDPIFRAHFKENNKRFEFSTDGHWNKLGHELVSEAIANSKTFQKF